MQIYASVTRLCEAGMGVGVLEINRTRYHHSIKSVKALYSAKEQHVPKFVHEQENNVYCDTLGKIMNIFCVFRQYFLMPKHIAV